MLIFRTTKKKIEVHCTKISSEDLALLRFQCILLASSGAVGYTRSTTIFSFRKDFHSVFFLKKKKTLRGVTRSDLDEENEFGMKKSSEY